MDEKKRKRRHGDRKDGRWLRSLDPYYSLSPFIMKTRQDSANLFRDSIEISEVERYLRKKRAEGLKKVGMLHLFVASYVQVAAQMPAINRFISGQRIYSRNNIEIIMTIKKEMKSDAGETSIKVVFDRKDTLEDVYNKMEGEIGKVKAFEDTSTDNVADMFAKLPRFLLNFAISFIKWLDYWGLVPKSLLAASPFHGSMVVTALGSLGIPPVFHHLYDFGNVPIFLAFGAKRSEYEVQKDGTVAEKKYIDYTVTSDERICDGFYFAHAFRSMKRFMKHPERLEIPPEEVVEDVD